MPHLILFDDHTWHQLLPLSFTKSIADLRIGIFTIRQKWEYYFQQESGTLTLNHLTGLYPHKNLGKDNLIINSSILPNPELVRQIQHLEAEEVLVDGDIVIALRHQSKHPPLIHKASGEWVPLIDDYRVVKVEHPYIRVQAPWDFFRLNQAAIEADFEIVRATKQAAPLPASSHFVGKDNVFIEEGASINPSFFDASEGLIYIAKGSTVMGGALVSKSLALCEHAKLKLGAKIYGATTLGPHVKVGGELSNTVIMGYSNKSHDGYLGNSVLGEWCNLGADTNCSNLKNNYGMIKAWSYHTEKMEPTGLQFCGLIMGDHSKCGINTMFNTGTIVGVCANIFGAGFPPKMIPSFAWGGADGFTTYSLNKAIETAKIVYGRRNKTLGKAEQDTLKAVYEMTQVYRNWG